MSSSILRTKSFSFAVRIVRLVQRLQKENREYVLSQQILKCGTSGGAQAREAQYAQSKKDFISKLSIGLKEYNETTYFLDLLHATGYMESSEYTDFTEACEELKAISIKSIKTAKENLLRDASLLVVGGILFTLLFSLFV
jgi:four helix bundle protein